MEMNKSLIVLGILISSFVFSVSFATLYAQTHILEGDICSCKLPLPLLIPTFSSFGLLIGLISYYLLFPMLYEKCTKSFSIFLEMLPKDERIVIEQVIKNGGIVTQAKLTRIMGKVKAFRAVERLKNRGIITKEKKGKTNKIRLNKKFEELILVSS